MRAMGVRPQSSFPSNQRGLTPMQQQYNIISHLGEGSRGAWERDDTLGKARHPVVVEHTMGSRVYQPMHSPDSGDEHSQPMAASGRSVGRQGSASQRSQSVDGNQRTGLRAASASAHQQQMHSPIYSMSNGHIQFDQQPPPSNRSQFQPQQQPHSNGHSQLSHTSPIAFTPASQYVDSQRFSPASPGGGGLSHASSVRFSANAANWSPGSPSPNGFNGSFGATTRAPLSLTAPSPSTGHAAAAASSTSRPGSAGAASESDDGAGFLEVGMAEDPNPRFRPTMEDSHVIKYGENWVEEDAATARGGVKSTARARASSLDWGSPPRKPAGSHSVAHKGGPHKSVKSGYFAIYDGHGGREAVDYIERNLHRSLASKLKAGAHPTQALESAFLETDQAMQQTRMYQDSGSTVAAALLRPSTSRAGQRDLFAANAGDARTVVAVHNGTSLQAVRLSRDHTPHDPAEAERVRRAGGTVFRGRVDGQLAVSRAIGDHSLKRSGVSAQPHQHHLPLTSDHKFVIVACDGLWDVMTDAEAVSLVAGMTDANKMADKLVKTAMARGTTDKSVHTDTHTQRRQAKQRARSREKSCSLVCFRDVSSSRLAQCVRHGRAIAEITQHAPLRSFPLALPLRFPFLLLCSPSQSVLVSFCRVLQFGFRFLSSHRSRNRTP